MLPSFNMIFMSHKRSKPYIILLPEKILKPPIVFFRMDRNQADNIN